MEYDLEVVVSWRYNLLRKIFNGSNSILHSQELSPMSQCKQTIPPFLIPLFWDYDENTVEINKHAYLIMARIMERGSWEAMIWLRKVYADEELATFLHEKGARILPPRELNYWALICGIPDETRRRWVKKTKEKKSVWSRRRPH